MRDVIRFEHVTRNFKDVVALNDMSLSIGPSRIVGLIGRNGSGKSTLLRHVVGIRLPTSGECFTLERPTAQLRESDLSRTGMVHQHESFLGWMKVRELLSYVSAFYERWDRQLEKRLLKRFELDETAKVDSLSPGKAQRLAILMAVAHHPELVLLDEPLSDLDPLAREVILQTILDVFRTDSPTIIISSHLLQDIERVIDHVVCIDEGRLLLDEPLDGMHERFAEWTVTSGARPLPDHFAEPWILSQSGTAAIRHLVVSDSHRQLELFRTQYDLTIASRPMNLNTIFTHLIGSSVATKEAAGDADMQVQLDKGL